MERLGIIAGNGKLPIVCAESARARGFEVIVVAISEEASSELEKVAHRVYWTSVCQLGKILATLHSEGIKKVVMAGKIKKTVMFEKLDYDDRLKSLLDGLGNRNDDSILCAFVNELKKEGISVEDSTTYIKDLLPMTGTLTSIEPEEFEWEDIHYGRKIAKEIAGLDIGQTVVVKRKAVLAVEAIEGTDEAIHRGGRLGRGDVVVAKVAKPNQDMRFDLPVVGMDTMHVLKEAGARVLVVDAGKTILLDKARVLEFAESNKIKIVAL